MFEGYRPGVMERLGLGPDIALGRNPKLIYGRMTGWGQTGPLAHAAGHDIDYIAISGALHAIGTNARPVVPLNLIGDYGGGALYLAMGLLAALVHARSTGQGQVVDAAMVDGAALLLAPFFAAAQLGFWGARGTNLLDTGAPFYDCYECADGGWVAVGALEPQFYAALLAGLGLTSADVPDQDDRTRWTELRQVLAARFASRPRHEWGRIFGPGGHDACVAPVLDLDEAPSHPHNAARSTFVEIEGVRHPAPAPRLSRTPLEIARRPCYPGEHTDEVLAEWGLDPDRIEALKADATIAQHE
jgi:alpha-methylacyl-CoA racemase